jgi:CheY-like chemotaxis protein
MLESDLLINKSINEFMIENLTHNGSVLVVEDDFVNVFILKQILDNFFDTKYAKSAKEVQEIIKNNTFHVILMDINLTDDSPDGVEIMKELRKDARFKDTKIFAVTSYHQLEEREKFLSEGFDSFFTKPVIREEILEAIQSAISNSGIRLPENSN